MSLTREISLSISHVFSEAGSSQEAWEIINRAGWDHRHGGGSDGEPYLSALLKTERRA